MTRRGIASTLSIALLAGLAIAVADDGGAGSASAARAGRAAAKRPNVVLVLTDDLSWNLVKYMPHVRAMQRHGLTFSKYFVTDSLCCPSRSSIFSGRFPHDTGVITNMGPDGGFHLFHNRGEESQTYATLLHKAGYMTGMMGKYLNGYRPAARLGGPRPFVPPGWDEWDVAGNAYAEFNYNLNENGRVVHYGRAPRAYLTDVIAGKGAAFIDRAASASKPFVLELATFAPHAPYTPAPRNANDFPGLRAPRGPAFNEASVADKPKWLRSHAKLSPASINAIDTAFRKRAQAVQAVDDMIARIQATLKARGLSKNTYLIFTSDNGYHLGEHRLLMGKMTAFETDIRVPLIVTGPHVPSGRTVAKLAENIDLTPTFARLAGASVPSNVDGHSLVSLLGGHRVRGWRGAALVEHHGPDFLRGDPDRPIPGSGNPTTYKAIRTASSVYVEYASGEREYYDLRRDPNELRNVGPRLSRRKRDRLHRTLTRLANCHSGRACWAAAR